MVVLCWNENISATEIMPMASWKLFKSKRTCRKLCECQGFCSQSQHCVDRGHCWCGNNKCFELFYACFCCVNEILMKWNDQWRSGGTHQTLEKPAGALRYVDEVLCGCRWKKCWTSTYKHFVRHCVVFCTVNLPQISAQQWRINV